jgi:hypothetical protein
VAIKTHDLLKYILTQLSFCHYVAPGKADIGGEAGSGVVTAQTVKVEEVRSGQGHPAGRSRRHGAGRPAHVRAVEAARKLCAHTKKDCFNFNVTFCNIGK